METNRDDEEKIGYVEYCHYNSQYFLYMIDLKNRAQDYFAIINGTY
jgi:hypothetical protein